MAPSPGSCSTRTRHKGDTWAPFPHPSSPEKAPQNLPFLFFISSHLNPHSRTPQRRRAPDFTSGVLCCCFRSLQQHQPRTPKPPMAQPAQRGAPTATPPGIKGGAHILLPLKGPKALTSLFQEPAPTPTTPTATTTAPTPQHHHHHHSNTNTNTMLLPAPPPSHQYQYDTIARTPHHHHYHTSTNNNSTTTPISTP